MRDMFEKLYVLYKLHKTSLKHPTHRNKEKYRAKHAEYKKHCDKAKKISWAEYKEKSRSSKYFQENN